MAKKDNVVVKIKKLHEDVKTPQYAHEGDACFDIHAYIPKGDLVYATNVIVDTGLMFEIPEGYVLKIYSRSGQGFNSNVRLANCTGIVDAGYRGEVKVKLTSDNRNPYPLTVKHGDKIAQGMLEKVIPVEFEEVDELSDSERGSGGFGSSGV